MDAAVANINRLTLEHKAAYFAMASYENEKVWDPTWVNPKSKEVEGKWRQRTQANAQFIRSFYLDLDIDPDDVLKFPTRDVALAEFEEFRVKVGLPAPMVVDSGGGFHMYWPLVHAVPTAQWRVVADQFKQICVALGFRADRSLTSDQARVLRALGSYNVRRDAPVRLLSTSTTRIGFDVFQRILDDYVSRHGLVLPSSRVAPELGNRPDIDLGDNLGPANDPINLDRVAFGCAQVGIQVGSRGASAGEQLWRATLGIVKFCEPQDLALRAVSDGYAGFDLYGAQSKMDNWRTGPTSCTHFHEHNPLTCEACPHWGKLTSPAQLGRTIREAAAPVVEVVDELTGVTTKIELPQPPDNYRRRADGAILICSEDKDEAPVYEVISPYDFYPTRLLRQAGGDSSIDERSMWRAHLPKVGTVDMEMPQSLVSDMRKLHAFLMQKGVYLNPDQAKAMQLYMSAYLQKLAADASREKLYERMGWHDNHKEFVLGNVVLTPDGKSHPHSPSRSIRAITKEGVRPQGTLEGWKDAIQFYNQSDMEGSRFFLYASLGAPLFHMNDTGNKGVLITASGASGRGKTTTLRACASIWGNPESLIVNGNRDGSTINAFYESLGTYHSLPYLWDDITEREPDEMRKVLLNISQGAGKLRMKDGAGISERRVEWETFVLSSANTDDVSRIMTSGKDVDPHLMRLIGVEFGLIDAGPKAKAKADNFIRAITNNHGHAGPVYMLSVLENYDVIRNSYISNIAKVDRMLNSSNASAERYWSAAVAAAYTGAKLAQTLDLLPGFPIEADLAWMIAHLAKQREQISEGRQSATELLSEFLELHISNTLVLSPKGASNIDNVVVKPYGSLLVRHEPDTGLMWVSRSALMEFCTKAKTSFRKMENDLELLGAITQRSALKVLGADTAYAKGQTRAWKIDARKLGGVLPAALTMAVNNVTPMNGTTP
jgi:hypothetical protein